MKRKRLILLAFSVIAAACLALSLILTEDKGAVFWIGFGFCAFSLLAVGLIIGFANFSGSAAFPLELSMISLSGLYLAATFCVNAVCGTMLRLDGKLFLSIHILFLAVFVAITLLLLLVRSQIVKRDRQEAGERCELQLAAERFEKINARLCKLEKPQQMEAQALLAPLLEEVRFSDVGSSIELSELADHLSEKTSQLSCEVEHLISIQAQDLSGMREIVNDIRGIIKERNMQIRRISSNI